LVVLDNCEHVLAAAAELVEVLLAHTPSVQVIATSREGLRVGAEHLWSVPTLDVRADIYALGTIAYHMLGGRPPFTGNITQLIAQKLMQLPPPLSSLRSDVSKELEASIMKALAKEPHDRPATATEWFEGFAEAISTESEEDRRGESRLVIMAPSGAEVYVDDERYGSVGRSGRVILTSVAPGKHVLRVSRSGEPDDERVIEIRSDVAEQIIEAQAKRATSSHLTPSRGGSLDSKRARNRNSCGGDVHEVSFSIRGRCKVLRPLW
jgi:serine/threonine protein kinase